MNRLRLAVLDASHNDPHTRRNFRRELDASLVEFDATSGHLPDALDFDGCIVSGSRASVYGNEEWIDPLVDWVADVTDHGLPTLGICFGHQVLAEALGGTVERMDDFEIGYREVRHRGDDLFRGIDEAFTVFTTHGDVVTDLPPGATLTAENDYGIHGLRKDHCFGIQFHPEYDLETAEVITRSKDFLEQERVRSVLDDIHEENYARACEAKRLFDNFLAYVEHARTGVPA